MSESIAVWEEPFSVRAYEMGPGRRAGARTVCNWLQEAAGNHAQALGWGMEHLLASGLTWVLSRFHLRVHRYPAWGEVVTVRTWPSGVLRLWALRDFLVFDRDGDTLAEATSAWLRIKVESKRPTRPDREFADLAAQAPPRALDDAFASLPDLRETEIERSFGVRFADLDINEHANNVAVITWLVEGAPEEALRHGTLRELEVEFRAEARYGDRLVGRCAESREDDGAYLHALTRAADADEIARARSVWEIPEHTRAAARRFEDGRPPR